MDPGADDQTLHGRLPAREREGRRPREGQRRLVRRTSSSTPARRTRSSRGRRRSGSASRRSPTRSAPASATSACAACSSARIDSLELGTLKLRNVPCLIKNPPLRDLPITETESLSPLALGFSMIIDYKTHKITFGKHLPAEPADFELPLRLYRLATVRGTVDGTHAGELRRRHRRRGDLDQPGDGDGARQAASRRGRIALQGVRHRRAGTRTRSCCRVSTWRSTRSTTRTSRSSC